MKTRFFGSLLLIATLFSFTGCSNLLRSDSRTASVIEPYRHVASINAQTKSTQEYANHCDERTREMQHELANCGAIPLIVVPLEPNT